MIKMIPIKNPVSFHVSTINAPTHKAMRVGTTTKGNHIMKTTKYAIITTVIALCSMAGNAYFLNNAHNAASALTECARTENVFACKFEAVPAESPKVIYRTTELLPPPSM